MRYHWSTHQLTEYFAAISAPQLSTGGGPEDEQNAIQVAVERAGCRPQECFYTDDIAAYIEAARRMGIDAVVFESRMQLEWEMRRRGIQWEQKKTGRDGGETPGL